MMLNNQIMELAVYQSAYGSIYNLTWFGENVLIINYNG